jgi:two-component system sensor histidine kinase PrrB
VVTRSSWSLRARVAAASAAGALLVVASAGLVLNTVLARQQFAALDGQLAQVSAVVTPVLLVQTRRPGATAAPRARQRLADRVVAVLGASFVGVAYRRGELAATTSNDPAAPTLDPLAVGTATVGTERGDYRVRTVAAGLRRAVTVSVGLPVQPVRDQVHRTRRAVLLVGLLAVLAAAGLGWLLAAPAVRPLRVLRDRALALVRRGEAEELAGALDQLLAVVDESRAREHDALATAREFATAAGHELRTPLTAMRTDLAVLHAHPDLDPAERAEVVASLDHARQRLESTLVALQQLARGDLQGDATLGPVDLADVVARAIDDVRRLHPSIELACHLPDGEVVVPGWEPGLRLALDNLLANAVRHGRATRLSVAVLVRGDVVAVTVDDDGPGIPEAERGRVVERFVRGTGAAPGGSGLGLALVAQQAALHGGRLLLLDAPTGGLRAVLEVGRGNALA